MKNATFRGENVHLCEHLAGSFRIIVWLTCLTFELRDTERRLPTVCPR